MSNKKDYSVDILIVGAGIAGATIAAGLRKKGYSIVQIENSKNDLDTARGDHLGPRVVEVLDKWDILKYFFEAGAEKRLGARWFDSNGQLIHHSSVDDLPIPFPYFIILNHELIASVSLGLALKESKCNYKLLRPVSLHKIVIDKEVHGGVKEVIVLNQKKEKITIKPKLTIACDGRSSRFRSACGFKISKTYNYTKPFVVLFGPKGELRDPRNEIINYISPEGGVSRIPRMGGQWKIGLAIEKEDIPTWKKSSVDERKGLIAKRSKQLMEIETKVAGFYPVIRREADNWVKGNTVLIGDACHTIHPSRGQGMNFGIRCAAKLFDFLPEPQDMQNIDLLINRLKDFEQSEKPIVDKQLEENHKYGLYTDTSFSSRFSEEIPHLEFLSRNIDANFRYRMTMAGYADQLN